MQAVADLDAHPDGDGQSNDHEENGEKDQHPAAWVDDIVRILQSCKGQTQVTCGFCESTSSNTDTFVFVFLSFFLS